MGLYGNLAEKCDKITIQRNSACQHKAMTRRHRLKAKNGPVLIKIDNRIPGRAIIDIYRLYYLTN